MEVTRSAVLDDAHVGDIRGALGTISLDDTAARTTLSAKLKTLLAIVGPGLIVMVGDNDAGAFSTYGQAGQDYGTRLLWTLVSIFVPNGLGIVLYFVLRKPRIAYCPQCEAEVDPTFSFCPRCRNHLKPACPQCQRSVNPGDKFCPYCGTAMDSAPASSTPATIPAQ